MTRRPLDHGVGARADVLLDIGGDVGALLVELAAAPASGELHAQPVGTPTMRFHTGVHARRAGKVVTNVAIFPAVRAGVYEILDASGVPFGHAKVTGGQVTRVRVADPATA